MKWDKEVKTSEYPVTCPLRPDLINEMLVGGGEGLNDNSEGIEICSFQYLEGISDQWLIRISRYTHT
jgi:hypothetical protein